MKLCLLVMSEATLTMSYQHDLSSGCKTHFKKPRVLAGTGNPSRDHGDRHTSWDSLVGLPNLKMSSWSMRFSISVKQVDNCQGWYMHVHTCALHIHTQRQTDIYTQLRYLCGFMSTLYCILVVSIPGFMPI